MRRWITIIASSLLLAWTGVAASAQAAMAQASPQAALSSHAAALVSTTGSDFGGNVELFAADASIAAAFAAVLGGIALSLRRRQDSLRRAQEAKANAEANAKAMAEAETAAKAEAKAEAEFAERLSSLKSAISNFRKATSRYRACVRRSADEEGRRARYVEDVQDSAATLMAAALGCGQYGVDAVQAAQELMEELGIELADIKDAKLAALESGLEDRTGPKPNGSSSSDD